MNCNVIATGSSGNAVLLDDRILIDCGIPYKTLAPYARGLRLVLLTHEHGDHFKVETIRRLHQERPTLRFGCCEWLVPHLLEAGVDKRVIDVYDPSIPAFLMYGGDVSVRVDLLAHDVPNCCYHLLLRGKRVFYATDTGTLDGLSAKDYDYYLIEANYGEAEIQERIQRKLEAGEFVYEYRAAAGHLSREQTDAWLEANATPGKSKIVYLHGHKEA